MNDPDITETAPRDRVAELLHRRYLTAFAIATTLLLLNQLLVQPPLLRLESDAPVINVAGRQRMLSQRLAKASLALVGAGNEAAREAHRDELKDVLRLWKASHDGLRYGDANLSLPGNDSAEIRAAFEDLEPAFRRMESAANTLIATTDARVAREQTNVILANDPDFLRRMDHIVGLYEADARGRASRLLWTGWIVTGLIVLALASVGWFVLVPASRIIGRQMSALRLAHDRLEERVRERTIELEHANCKLEVEHRERLAAEERHRVFVEQLGHSARVNTMGEMASGLAHELNQPLGAIANYVGGCLERLKTRSSDFDDLREVLEKAQAAALRAGEIVRRIRTFVTRHSFEQSAIDPGGMALEAVEFVRSEAERRGIALDATVAPDLPLVRGDSVQLQQVLLNLIRNAFDAVEAGKPMNSKVLVRVERPPGGCVSFAVVDNGEGLGPERIKRIFEPFFSTRAEGMGMGLAISRGIVEAHQGQIDVEAEPNQPTTVRFTLPALSDQPSEPRLK